MALPRRWFAVLLFSAVAPIGCNDSSTNGDDGAPCTSGRDCKGGLCDTTMPGGYCSTDCSTSGKCNGNAACLPTGDPSQSDICLASCSAATDCRKGYTCVLLPDGSGLCAPAGAGADGAACTSGSDCQGGICVTEADGAPGGYCTTIGCTKTACHGDASCFLVGNDDSMCLAACTEARDCRQGYVCLSEGNGKYCNLPPSTPGTQTDFVSPLSSSCNGTRISSPYSDLDVGRRFTFNVGRVPTAVFFAPYSASGKPVVPISVTLPDGSAVDLLDNYSFMMVDLELFSFPPIVPFFFPGASQYDPWLQQGHYLLDVVSTDDQICAYAYSKSTTGATLELNVYIVGVTTAGAQQIVQGADFQAVLKAANAIYAQAGMQLNVASVAGINDSTFKIITSESQEHELMQGIEPADNGTVLASAMRANLVLVDDFNIPNSPGLLGASQGIPGTHGIYHTAMAGLIFRRHDLGRDNTAMAKVMAHEIGHWLGLRHTTEHGGSSWDPISDTPGCKGNPDKVKCSACQDGTNLMYPFACGGQTITTGQGYVLTHSPVVQ